MKKRIICGKQANNESHIKVAIVAPLFKAEAKKHKLIVNFLVYK